MLTALSGKNKVYGLPLVLAPFVALSLLGCEPAALTDDEADDGPFGAVDYTAASEPPGYYASATGKTGAALLNALQARVAGHKALGYNQARDTLFASVSDPKNSNEVECVYTGRIGRPVANTANASALDMNTEHVWPQSLGATGSGKTDLHHLYAVDEQTNGRRGNYPFGEVKTVTWTAPNLDGDDASRLGQNSSGRLVFEPEARQKGNIARGILYFYTRYAAQPTSGFTLSNFAVERAVLLKWHQADPPDANERLRNDAVFGVQGNRNPYIDHPEFAAAIGTFP